MFASFLSTTYAAQVSIAIVCREITLADKDIKSKEQVHKKGSDFQFLETCNPTEKIETVKKKIKHLKVLFFVHLLTLRGVSEVPAWK